MWGFSRHAGLEVTLETNPGTAEFDSRAAVRQVERPRRHRVREGRQVVTDQAAGRGHDAVDGLLQAVALDDVEPTDRLLGLGAVLLAKRKV